MLFTGIYTREDDLALFEYEVTLSTVGTVVEWVARLTSDGTFRGKRSGSISDIAGLDAESIELAVRDVVETSIRARDGVA